MSELKKGKSSETILHDHLINLDVLKKKFLKGGLK